MQWLEVMLTSDQRRVLVASKCFSCGASNSPILQLPKKATTVQVQNTLLLSSGQPVCVMVCPRRRSRGRVNAFRDALGGCRFTEMCSAPLSITLVMKSDVMLTLCPMSLWIDVMDAMYVLIVECLRCFSKIAQAMYSLTVLCDRGHVCTMFD